MPDATRTGDAPSRVNAGDDAVPAALRNVTGPVADAVRALERSLESVLSHLRTSADERAQTLQRLHAVFSQPELSGPATQAVATSYVEMLRCHGMLLTMPARALDSTTIQQAQCVRALESLIAGNLVDPGPWHIAGVSLIDASGQHLRMSDVRAHIVDRIAKIMRVDAAIADWTATTILAQRQASLLCDDAPAELVYGSLDWTDLQIGCDIARTFDADSRTLNYTTLAGLAVALDQDIREKTVGAHWFELGSNTAVVFAASRNATHVRALLERPVVDMRELEHGALRELDVQRLARWQRVHRIATHLDAFRTAWSVPVPQWRRVAADLLWEFDLAPGQQEAPGKPTLLDQVVSGPPYDSYELVLAAYSMIAAGTQTRTPDLTPDIDQRFRHALDRWLTTLRDAFVNVAHDTVTAFVSAHRAAAASISQIEVLETHVRKPAGAPLSTSELVGIASQRHGGDVKKAYDEAMRARVAGRFHPELPTRTVFRVRGDTGIRHDYVFDLTDPRGPVIEPLGQDIDESFDATASVPTRLYGTQAMLDASREGAKPEYRIAVRQRLDRAPDATRSGNAGERVDDETAAPWDGLASALAEAFANKVSVLLSGETALAEARQADTARPGAVMSLLPFVTCIDAIEHGEAGVAFVSCALDGLAVIPAVGVAVREGAAFAELTARSAFAGTLSRTLPRAESRFVLSRLASDYLRNVQLSASQAAPQFAGDAFEALDPGFVLAWRLIRASAHGASRLLTSLAARSRLAPYLKSFRPTPEALRTLYAKTSSARQRPKSTGALEGVVIGASARPAEIDAQGLIEAGPDGSDASSGIVLDGVTYPAVKRQSAADDAVLNTRALIEAPDGLSSAFRLPVEFDPDAQVWRIEERYMGMGVDGDAIDGAARPAGAALGRIEHLEARVLIRAEALRRGAESTSFNWGYIREFEPRLLPPELTEAPLDELRERFLDEALGARERGELLRLIDDRELATLGEQGKQMTDRLIADPSAAPEFARGCLSYAEVTTPGFSVDMPEARLRALFISEGLTDVQRGALWARIEQAEHIRRAERMQLELIYWSRSFEDGASHPYDYVIDAFEQGGETYPAYLRALAGEALSAARSGAVYTRMAARKAIIDAQGAVFDQRALDAQIANLNEYSFGYEKENSRAAPADDTLLETLYEHAKDRTLTSEQIGAIAARVHRERERYAALFRESDAKVRRNAGDAAYIVAGVRTDSLANVWLVPVPGLDASLKEPELARRFVEVARSDDFTAAQKVRAYERFVVVRNYGRLLRRIDAIARTRDAVGYHDGYEHWFATLQGAGIDANRFRNFAGFHEFECEIARDHPVGVYGALRAVLLTRLGESAELQLGIARYNVISSQRVVEYLKGYLQGVPIGDGGSPLPADYRVLFRAGTLSDRELGSLAARIDLHEGASLLANAREGSARFEQIFREIGRPDTARYVASAMLPSMLEGVMSGSCYALSVVTALAISRGPRAVEAWFKRFEAVQDFVARARAARTQQAVADAVAEPAMPGLRARPDASPLLAEIEPVAETIGVLSALQLAQPGFSTMLTRGQVVVEPSRRARAWLDTLHEQGPGIWIVGPPDHALVLAIGVSEAFPHYLWFEPNYGLFGYEDVERFRAFLRQAVLYDYGVARDFDVAGNDPLNVMFDFWRVDGDQLARLRTSADPNDARTLADFVASPAEPLIEMPAMAREDAGNR